MSIATSFTLDGKCIYDEDGEIVLGKGKWGYGAESKVLRRCDRCEKLDWIGFRGLIRQRKYDGKDYCKDCAYRVKVYDVIKSKSPEEKEKINDKKIETCRKNYDVDYPSQSKVVREKYKKTCIEKFGVGSPMQSEKVKKKRVKTCIERYGVSNYCMTEEFLEKYKKTMLERYGVETSMLNPESLEKYKETSKKNYGTDFPMQSLVIREKTKKTNLDKYGVEYTSQLETHRKMMSELYSGENHPQWNPDRHDVYQFNLFKVDVYRISNLNYKFNFDIINPNNFSRGKGEGFYQVDHKRSVKQCWDDGVYNIFMVSCVGNLEMMPSLENTSKGLKSSITLKEFLNYFNEETRSLSGDINFSGKLL